MDLATKAKLKEPVYRAAIAALALLAATISPGASAQDMGQAIAGQIQRGNDRGLAHRRRVDDLLAPQEDPD